MSPVLQLNSFVEKAYVTLVTLVFAEHVRGGPKKRQMDARTVSVSGEARECELSASCVVEVVLLALS